MNVNKDGWRYLLGGGVLGALLVIIVGHIGILMCQAAVDTPARQDGRTRQILQNAKSGELVVCGIPDNPDADKMAVLVQQNHSRGFSGYEYRKSSVKLRDVISHSDFRDCRVRVLKRGKASFPFIIGNIVYDPPP